MKIELPYNPAIPLLGIHTEETRTERDTCTLMFIAALFIIARTWKQPKCPSADNWIKDLRIMALPIRKRPSFHSLEKEMVTHSSVLAWRIPGTGKPGGLSSMGSH